MVTSVWTTVQTLQPGELLCDDVVAIVTTKVGVKASSAGAPAG